VRLIQKVGDWFDLRLQLGKPIRETSRAPRSARDRKLVLCFRQRRAHVFRAPDVDWHSAALIYVPSAGEAWNSLQTLNHGIALVGSYEPCMGGVRTSWSRLS